MKLSFLAMSAALITSIALGGAGVVSAQPSPTGDYEPGFWQPEATIDPNRLIEVRLVNEADIAVRYGGTVQTPEGDLFPDGVVQFPIAISDRTGDIASIPVYDPTGNAQLNFDFGVLDNVLVVLIRPRNEVADETLDKAVYIDERGRAYAF